MGISRTALAALALGILAGCTTPSPSTNGGTTTTPPTTVATKTTAIVDKTISIAQQTCKFIPTADTVIGIFAKNNATLNTASEIASAICDAVSAKTSVGLLFVPPSVDGVTVKGKFAS